MNVVSVGIDISKGKCMVAAMRPFGEMLMPPREFSHTDPGLGHLAGTLTPISSRHETRVITEATGRYHEPVAAALQQAGLWVCVLNPIVIKQSGAGSVRKVKTDKKDAVKTAKYGTGNWNTLREHLPADVLRQQLKLFSRQYDKYMGVAVSLRNNLVSLLDKPTAIRSGLTSWRPSGTAAASAA
jgi:transposase